MYWMGPLQQQQREFIRPDNYNDAKWGNDDIAAVDGYGTCDTTTINTSLVGAIGGSAAHQSVGAESLDLVLFAEVVTYCLFEVLNKGTLRAHQRRRALPEEEDPLAGCGIYVRVCRSTITPSRQWGGPIQQQQPPPPPQPPFLLQPGHVRLPLVSARSYDPCWSCPLSQNGLSNPTGLAHSTKTSMSLMCYFLPRFKNTVRCCQHGVRLPRRAGRLWTVSYELIKN